MIELHFSVAGYGGLHLPFSGITQYLRGLVSVYERPIIAGVRILIISSIPWLMEAFIQSCNLETLKEVAFLTRDYRNQCYVTTTVNNYLQL